MLWLPDVWREPLFVERTALLLDAREVFPLPLVATPWLLPRALLVLVAALRPLLSLLALLTLALLAVALLDLVLLTELLASLLLALLAD